MVDPNTNGWVQSLGINTTNLNLQALYRGAALPSSDFSEDALFLYTGDGVIYENTGTYATPVWTARTPAAGQAYDEIIALSTTIGDYASPAAATASSGVISTFDSVWGPSNNQSTEDFSLWASQAALDTAWVTVNTTYLRANFTNQRIECNMVGADANGTNGMYHDIKGAIFSDSGFAVRFKLTVNTLDNITGGSAQAEIYFGLSSAGDSGNSSIDRIMFAITGTGSTKQYKILATDATALAFSGTAFSHAATTETIYVEMIRTSTTSVTVNLYSDSTYATLIETKTVTIAATIQNLRYFQCYTRDNCTAGNITCYADDLQIFDGAFVDHTAHKVFDGDTATYWQSNGEANPNIYFDFGTARDHVNFAIALHTSTTTITQIKIRISTDSSFSDGETVRTIDVSDFTNDTYRYIVFNRPAANARYVQIYGVGTGVLAVTEFKSRYGLSDVNMFRWHFHNKLATLTTVTGLDSD